MNRLFLARPALAVMAATLFLAGWMDGGSTQMEFQPQTTMRIEGTSSLHDFTCSAPLVSGVMEVSAPGATATAEVLAALSVVNVEVPVGKIDCGNGTMDKKMRQALNEKSAPVVTYRMTSVEVSGQPDANGLFLLKTKGRLSIGGTEKVIDMDVRGGQNGDGTFNFTGSKKIKMSEFGIKPPSAMLGAVKTGDEVTVHFEVVAGSSS